MAKETLWKTKMEKENVEELGNSNVHNPVQSPKNWNKQYLLVDKLEYPSSMQKKGN